MGPDALFIAGMIGSAVGTGVTALGAYQSSKMQEEAAEANRATEEANAKLHERQQRRDSERVFAEAANAMAGSGLLVSGGSSLLALADIAAQQEEKALLIRYGGEVSSFNAGIRAKAYGSQAKASLISGTVKTGSGLLGDAYTYGTQFGGASKSRSRTGRNRS